MEEMSNYEWIELLPDGWHSLAKAMIDECMAADPTYRIIELKEKWGQMRVYSECATGCFSAIEAIEERYESKTGKVCVKCGAPATHYTTGWILPICNNCMMGV